MKADRVPRAKCCSCCCSVDPISRSRAKDRAIEYDEFSDPTLDIVTPHQIRVMDELFAMPCGSEYIIHLEEDELI